jgi:hypothetical protein
MKRKEGYDMKCRRHIQRMQAIVVLLLCSALSLSVVSVGVPGEQKEAPIILREGQIKAIKIDKCGLEPGSCEGSIVLAPKGGGEEVTLAVKPGTWIQHGDKLVLISELSVGNYLKVRAMAVPAAAPKPGTVGCCPGERPYLLEETSRE